MSKNALRDATISALIHGWNANWEMWRVVSHAWKLADTDEPEGIERYTLLAVAIKVPRIQSTDSAKCFVARNLPQLNEALWAGRNAETCMVVAKRCMGVVGTKSTKMIFGVRQRDKSTDWKTCK